MDVVKQSEFCAKSEEVVESVLVKDIKVGTVFRGSVHSNPKHVWMRADNYRIICIGEPTQYKPIGSYGSGQATSAEKGNIPIRHYEELDAVIVIKD